MIVDCIDKKAQFSVDECLECARMGDPPCAFTYGILRILYNEYTPVPKRVRVTELTGCIRQAVLKRKIEFSMKPYDLFRMAKGTAIHAAIAAGQEKAPELLSEYKIELKLDNGYTLSGTLDEFDVRNGILRDYKDVAEMPRYNKPFAHHIEQVNCYKYLLEKTTKYEVKQMQIVYMDTYTAKKFAVDVIPDIDKMINEKIDKMITGLKKSAEAEPTFGWTCNYCPREIYARCRAIEFRKIAKTTKFMKLEEIEEYIKNHMV